MALAWLLILLWSGVAHAQTQVNPTQGQNSLNQEITSGVNLPIVITLATAPHTRAKLNGVSAFCSAGTAILTVSDGGVERFRSDASTIGIAQTSFTWIPPFTGGIGNAVVITLSTCGAGNVGTMSIQAEIS